MNEFYSHLMRIHSPYFNFIWRIVRVAIAFSLIISRNTCLVWCFPCCKNVELNTCFSDVVVQWFRLPYEKRRNNGNKNDLKKKNLIQRMKKKPALHLTKCMKYMWFKYILYNRIFLKWSNKTSISINVSQKKKKKTETRSHLQNHKIYGLSVIYYQIQIKWKLTKIK